MIDSDKGEKMLPGVGGVSARQRTRSTASARRRRLSRGKLTAQIEHFGYDVGVALRAGSLPADARPALEALIATLAEILGEPASLEPFQAAPVEARSAIERLF
jgi:hypothetical protein